MLAVGARLAQIRPANTSNATLFSPTVVTELTSIFVCNTTGSAATFRLFHSRGATVVFDQTTALYYDFSVAANDTKVIRASAIGGGLQTESGDDIGVRSSTASALTFTLYGVTTKISEDRVGRRGLGR